MTDIEKTIVQLFGFQYSMLAYGRIVQLNFRTEETAENAFEVLNYFFHHNPKHRRYGWVRTRVAPVIYVQVDDSTLVSTSGLGTVDIQKLDEREHWLSENFQPSHIRDQYTEYILYLLRYAGIPPRIRKPSLFGRAYTRTNEATVRRMNLVVPFVKVNSVDIPRWDPATQSWITKSFKTG